MFNSLKYNERVQLYLSKYNPEMNDNFLRDYVLQKKIFIAEGESAAQKATERDENIIELAQKCLLEIQLKKLFDVMLQWNANMFKHESIEVCRDYEKWEYQLTDCPFLSPISKEEFELYLQYAQSPEFDYEAQTLLALMAKYFDIEWHEKNSQNADKDEEDMMDEMQTEDIENECKAWDKDIEWDDNAEVDKEIKWQHFVNQPDFPAWFAYNNAHTNNGDYLKLPQIRCVKENFYIQLEEEDPNTLGINEEDDDDMDDMDFEPVKPNATAFDYYTVKKFILACEDKDVLDKFTKYYDANPHEIWQYNKERERHAWLEANAREAFEQLIGMKKLVPSLANKDWRKALIDARDEFRKQEIVKMLPYVFSDYCMRLNTGIGFDWQYERGAVQLFATEYIRNRILRGRLLNGESEDFNF